MSISNNNLQNKIKYLYKSFKIELELNEPTLDWLDELKYEKFMSVDKSIECKDTIDITNTMYSKKEIDEKYIKYYNEYTYNNNILVIYRNFLVVLFFMKSFHRKNTDKINTKNSNALERFILEKLPSKKAVTKTQYQKLFNNNSNINGIFNDFSKLIFKDLDISINIRNLVIGYVSNEDEFQQNKFINYWIDLLKEENIVIISTFFEVLANDYKTFNIPTSINSFLRYYLYNDTAHNRNSTESVYFSGVGTNVLISSVVSDSLNKKSDGFSRKLNIGIDDINDVSLQIRKIRNRLITDNTDMIDTVVSSDILDTSFENSIYDTVISIPPQNLTLMQTSMFISDNKDNDFINHNVERYINFNPLPKKNLSCFVHYYNATKIAKNKILMIVPISFITLNDYTKNLNSLENIENRNQFTESNIHSVRFKEIVEEQLIKKVMLLPKNMFSHTKEQCVLLELSTTANDGVMFIDGTKFTKIVKNQVVFQNKQSSKNEFDGSTNKHYVEYNSIIHRHNYNILPLYHLSSKNTTIDTPNSIKTLSSVFKITKSQRFNPIMGKNQTEQKKEIEISFISKSNFNQFNITSELDSIKKRTIIKDIKKFNHSSRVLNNDILIHTNYVNASDITIMQMKKSEICIANHNLIIIRNKSNNSTESQKLFLWLMSEKGHEYLTSISKNTNGKYILKIDDLKDIPISYDDIDISVFEKVKKEVNSINNKIDRLKKLYN